MGTRTTYLFGALALLVGAAVAVLTAEHRNTEVPPAQAEAFHRLTGGIGFGPALDLADCPFGFDPRLDGACAADRGPVPGGSCFCPRHAGSLFGYPPLVPDAGR